jgi:Fe-S cluster assembly protein SufD
MSGLAEIRSAAARRFAELGYPTKRDEEWRFTNVAPIAKTAFGEAPQASVTQLSGEAEEFLERLEGVGLVFLNGRYAPELSTRKLPAGIVASSLRQANGFAERHLARYADWRQHPFVAYNTARFDDGAYVEVPEKVILSEPVHLVFVSTEAEQPFVTHPRSLVVIGEGSQVRLVESYFGQGKYFTNAVTEIVAGDRSVVEHYKLQDEDETAFHIATVQAQAGRDASVATYSLSFGGGLVRNDINAVLSEGCDALMNGLYIVNGVQHVDHHTTIDHSKPHGTSRELYKGILDGNSSAVFNGRIIVRKDAQKTDSKQSNKNLVLSEDATINTKPELQILADDVRCTHGATIGQLDADAVFYLQSRGIARQEARDLLTRAFAQEILEDIKVEGIRDRLDGLVWERLHAGRN